jgi:hypothetical protein
MSNRGRVGIPTSRAETDLLEINADGSINVRQRIADVLGQDPVRVLVGIVATQIVDENTERRAIDIFNNGATIIYLGFDDTVALLTGMPLLPYTGVVYNGYQGEVWGISTVINTDIRVLEMNDSG